MSIKPSGSHGKRLITAAWLIPFLFIILYWGGALLFLLLVWAGFTLANREFFFLIYEKPSSFLIWFYWLIGSSAIGAAYIQGLEGFFAVLILGMIFAVVYLVCVFQKQASFFESVGRQLLTVWYLPLFFPFFVLIRSANDGLLWIFFLLAVNYAGDTGAFYVGRTWGRHKLAPLVSPKKTIEGSLGGLAANGMVALAFKLTVFGDVPWFEMIGLGLLAGIVGQLGDLLESMIKRAARVKDSGTLFPGHGGILDRIDSLLLSAPGIYFYILFLNQKGFL